MCKITLDARCTFRLRLSDPSEADEFTLEGEDGAYVPLFYQVESSTISAAGVDLVDGRSGPASTQEGVHTVVLRRNGADVRREAVEFRAGKLHEIEL